ncbi:hypothetical protein DCAR_0414451 [Daucus carota subsp. sativus]|uniref:Tf2-1-like SH3-like domain-containing protein n=1 Tax=Daucus carota subsp. sativus TaxID=79200 RepID=A0AAF0WVC4_DAUCS|nr:hypothetical protein DCAR_0414451 [Daucus carota subsp. sativus]
MPPYEALYGRKCRSPIYWDEVGERKVIGPELIQQTKEAVDVIRSRLIAAQDRQRKYADPHRKDVEFEIGEAVLLKVSPWKGIARFEKKGKLSPRFIGPFEILSRIGKVAYELALPPQMQHVHNVFHVSLLKKFNPDTKCIIENEPVEIEPDLSYIEQPVSILDRKDKVLRNKTVPLVRVLWRNPKVEESTWELESDMLDKYPHFRNGALILVDLESPFWRFLYDDLVLRRVLGSYLSHWIGVVSEFSESQVVKFMAVPTAGQGALCQLCLEAQGVHELVLSHIRELPCFTCYVHYLMIMLLVLINLKVVSDEATTYYRCNLVWADHPSMLVALCVSNSNKLISHIAPLLVFIPCDNCCCFCTCYITYCELSYILLSLAELYAHIYIAVVITLQERVYRGKGLLEAQYMHLKTLPLAF